jgi:hypothetical protein
MPFTPTGSENHQIQDTRVILISMYSVGGKKTIKSSIKSVNHKEKGVPQRANSCIKIRHRKKG